jgi:hypothetical protein
MMRVAALLLLPLAVHAAPGDLLFQEGFEDTAWASRGWYDGPHMEIDDGADAPEGEHAMVWHWEGAGAIGPSGGGARLPLPERRDVTLAFWMKVSDNWEWTGVPYHPHMFHFLTNLDDRWVGPSWTHLTTYIEAVNGIPRLALQDGRNIDTTAVRQDITAVSEKRAVAGCNGDLDGDDEADCYQAGGNWVNGKVWRADRRWLAAEPGPGYQGDWHEIRARFRLNSVDEGVTHADGVLQMWFDGQLIIDDRAAVLRTSQHPQMAFNQFLMGPYVGPGVPHAQSMWIDDLRIWESPAPAPTRVEAATWGEAKKAGRAD